MNDFQTIETNEMADVTGGGVGKVIYQGAKAGGKWIARHWEGVVSAADLAYNVGKDFITGGKKEAPAAPAK